MGWTPTIGIFVAAMAVVAFARYQDERDRPFGEVSLVPWTSIMIIASVVALLMVVHAVNLMGVKTGRF